MDDFEKDYPGFDWRNTPAYKHPGGRDCPCPKHEYVREQINIAKAVSKSNKEAGRLVLKFCPDHYKVYLNEVIPTMPLKYRILTKVALKIGAIQIQQLKYMQSDQCFYCKFGSGGHDKKSELPPIG
ncbi:MAG: hypothetical protein HY295_00850 [Thaumarchaeota archaeon]|nr:hypothetical protein [Nitrososphaerota archaeon]